MLKAPEHLKSHADKEKDERPRLDVALRLNQPLATAYYMKKRLRLLFQCHDLETARRELTAWIEEAAAWKPSILDAHKHRISTGLQEAIHGNIGTLQRNARGYRDDEYLKLRIFHLHNKTYALTG